MPLVINLSVLRALPRHRVFFVLGRSKWPSAREIPKTAQASQGHPKEGSRTSKKHKRGQKGAKRPPEAPQKGSKIKKKRKKRERQNYDGLFYVKVIRKSTI